MACRVARAVGGCSIWAVAGRYYYAGGKRHALERDGTRCAVDVPLARARGVEVPAAAEGTALPGDLVLLSRERLGKAAPALESIGALHTVYSSGEVTAVPLPEVRIEVEGPTQHAAAMKALSSSEMATEIVKDADGMIVVRLKSGSGDEALDLASRVYEQAHPAAASPRFIQITRRPSVHPERAGVQRGTKRKATR